MKNKPTTQDKQSNLLFDLLGFQLNAAKKLIFDSFVGTLVKNDLTPGLFEMLVVIDANSGINQTELSALLEFDGSQTVRYLDTLESLSLVKRTRSQKDRRNQIIQIERKGKSLLLKLFGEIQTHEKHAANELTTQEQKQLGILLQKLNGVWNESVAGLRTG